MGSIPRAAAVVWCTLRTSGARNTPRWLAARTISSDSQASVGALYDTVQCGTWCECVGVWVCGWVGVRVCGRVGVWACACVFGGGMIEHVNFFFVWISRLADFFDWIPQLENSVKKNWVENSLFRLCKKTRFGPQSKRPFLTDKSDCEKNGLSFRALFLLYEMNTLRNGKLRCAKKNSPTHFFPWDRELLVCGWLQPQCQAVKNLGIVSTAGFGDVVTPFGARRQIWVDRFLRVYLCLAGGRRQVVSFNLSSTCHKEAQNKSAVNRPAPQGNCGFVFALPGLRVGIAQSTPARQVAVPSLFVVERASIVHCAISPSQGKHNRFAKLLHVFWVV